VYQAKLISDIQNNLYDEKLLLKPLVPHITIVHPNSLATVSPLWILPKINNATSHLLPININIDGLGSFSKYNLHLKVSSPQLNEIHHSIISLLPPNIYAANYIGKNQFVPHITIAQCKPMQQLSPKYINAYSQELKSLIGTQFNVKQLTKFEHTAPRQYQVKII